MAQGPNLLDRLRDLHRHHGMYREALVSSRDGIAGAAEIRAMMDGFRTTPPPTSGRGGGGGPGSPRRLERTAPSNVIQFLTEEGALVQRALRHGAQDQVYFRQESGHHGGLCVGVDHGDRIARFGEDLGVEISL